MSFNGLSKLKSLLLLQKYELMQLLEFHTLFANASKKQLRKDKTAEALCEVIQLMELIEPAFWGNKSR